ncbi:GlxA family transcriptional regulator [Nocardia huaxiensis]|uniref:GlxA family transcriptional regulator n=1 Tax=Nocardia huaxiensis TaxID=2755382 RepID=A0A7D6V718_9NOCA|nr:GlxA family transcriptional regulator [Nocardia huaxiensis]QLY27753.1 GlxA family transcriptional regulator [Nocardia huaxiensis]UFS98853.1 GlxA family transcriptional regulator [Nocardia huaxiensis]
MTRKIAVLAYEGVRLLDATAPLEVFSTATDLGGAYELILCSPTGGPVTTSAGTSLTVNASFAEVRDAHTVLVPGSSGLPHSPVPRELLDAIPDFAASARRIASVCTGAFALAQAGVLDGRRATTHWRHTAMLARVHPRITVEPDAIYVRDGSVFTSAGVSAGIDLALALIEEDEGADLAREVARDLVVFLQRPGGQSQFSVASRLPRPRHDPLRALLDSILADPAADHSLSAMASRAALSVRHLTRLFHEHLHTTPAAFVESVRLEAAQSMLESGESITSAARRSGLGSDESLRRIFLRHFGVTPSAYRARFRTASR